MGTLLFTSILGAASIIIGYKLNSNYRYLKKNGLRSEGRVRGYNQSNRSPMRNSIYYPIVSFKDTKGNLFEEELSIGYSYKPWSKGDKFEVIYDPNNPSNVIISNQPLGGLGPNLFSLVGLLVFIFGILNYLEVI